MIRNAKSNLLLVTPKWISYNAQLWSKNRYTTVTLTRKPSWNNSRPETGVRFPRRFNRVSFEDAIASNGGAYGTRTLVYGIERSFGKTIDEDGGRVFGGATFPSEVFVRVFGLKFGGSWIDPLDTETWSRIQRMLRQWRVKCGVTTGNESADASMRFEGKFSNEFSAWCSLSISRYLIEPLRNVYSRESKFLCSSFLQRTLFWTNLTF